MEFLQTFIAEYGTMILYAVLVAIGGAIGAGVKKIYQRYIDTKVKKEVVDTCVKAVEQLYKDLDGEQKLEKCIESAVEMLDEKGIKISALELRYDLEAAVIEFKKKLNGEEVTAEDAVQEDISLDPEE